MPDERDRAYEEEKRGHWVSEVFLPLIGWGLA